MMMPRWWMDGWMDDVWNGWMDGISEHTVGLGLRQRCRGSGEGGSEKGKRSALAHQPGSAAGSAHQPFHSQSSGPGDIAPTPKE